MAWLEVSVKVIPEAAEAVAEVFSRYAPEGVAIDLPDPDAAPAEVTVKAYLPLGDDIEQRRNQVLAGLGHLHHIWNVIPEPTFTRIEDQDWTAAWKASIPVLHIGRKLVIKPSWRNYQPLEHEVVLEMDPGLAFGTGLHPTTQLCVEAIEKWLQPNARVLDLGTGTGILALAAASLGAAHVLAVDTDDKAVAAARANVHKNELSGRIEIVHGSLDQAQQQYDLVVANILAPVIIAMTEAGLAKRLATGGALIVSGILAEQEAAVEAAMQKVNLRVVKRYRREEWVALVAKHPFSAPPGQNRKRMR